MTADQVQSAFPGWRVWPGVNGMVYARWLRAEPPVLVRAHNWTALRAAILKRQEQR